MGERGREGLTVINPKLAESVRSSLFHPSLALLGFSKTNISG
jgi:hypothetical protein